MDDIYNRHPQDPSYAETEIQETNLHDLVSPSQRQIDHPPLRQSQPYVPRRWDNGVEDSFYDEGRAYFAGPSYSPAMHVGLNSPGEYGEFGRRSLDVLPSQFEGSARDLGIRTSREMYQDEVEPWNQGNSSQGYNSHRLRARDHVQETRLAQPPRRFTSPSQSQQAFGASSTYSNQFSRPLSQDHAYDGSSPSQSRSHFSSRVADTSRRYSRDSHARSQPPHQSNYSLPNLPHSVLNPSVPSHRGWTPRTDPYTSYPHRQSTTPPAAVTSHHPPDFDRSCAPLSPSETEEEDGYDYGEPRRSYDPSKPIPFRPPAHLDRPPSRPQTVESLPPLRLYASPPPPSLLSASATPLPSEAHSAPTPVLHDHDARRHGRRVTLDVPPQFNSRKGKGKADVNEFEVFRRPERFLQIREGEVEDVIDEGIGSDSDDEKRFKRSGKEKKGKKGEGKGEKLGYGEIEALTIADQMIKERRAPWEEETMGIVSKNEKKKLGLEDPPANWKSGVGFGGSAFHDVPASSSNGHGTEENEVYPPPYALSSAKHSRRLKMLEEEFGNPSKPTTPSNEKSTMKGLSTTNPRKSAFSLGDGEKDEPISEEKRLRREIRRRSGTDKRGRLLITGGWKRWMLRWSELVWGAGVLLGVAGAGLLTKPKEKPPLSGTFPQYSLYILSIPSFLITLYVFFLAPFLCGGRRRKEKLKASNPVWGGMVIPVVGAPKLDDGWGGCCCCGGRDKKKKKQEQGQQPVSVNLIVDPRMWGTMNGNAAAKGGPGETESLTLTSVKRDSAERERKERRERRRRRRKEKERRKKKEREDRDIWERLESASEDEDLYSTSKRSRLSSSDSETESDSADEWVIPKEEQVNDPNKDIQISVSTLLDYWKHGRRQLKMAVIWDLLLFLLWTGDAVFTIGISDRCPSGTFDGWCNWYNFALASSVLLALSFLGSLVFDFIDMGRSKQERPG